LLLSLGIIALLLASVIVYANEKEKGSETIVLNQSEKFNVPLKMLRDTEISEFEYDYIDSSSTGVVFDPEDLSLSPQSRLKVRSIDIIKYIGSESIVSIPSIINEVNVKVIKSNAFVENANLKYVILPESITKIEKGAFKNCANLIGVVVPESIESIEEESFVECNKLKLIVKEGSAAHVYCSQYGIPYELYGSIY